MTFYFAGPDTYNWRANCLLLCRLVVNAVRALPIKAGLGGVAFLFV